MTSAPAIGEVDRMDRDGFEIHSGVFDSADVDEVVAAVEAAFLDVRNAGCRDVASIPALASLAQRSELHHIASSILGDYRSAVPEHVCAVSRGGVLAMRPLILHASSAAIHPRHRRVLHVEFAAESLPGGLGWRNQNARPIVAYSDSTV